MARSAIPFREAGGMKGAIMAGLLGTLGLILGSCGDKRSPDQAAQTNPPPKPPNCPETPELQNVTLTDGTVADVRIITNGEITFYVPRDWFREIHDRPSIKMEPFRQHLDPYLDYEECPGIVHRWVSKAADGKYGFSLGTPTIDRIRNRAAPNFSLASLLDEVSFGHPLPMSLNAHGLNVDQILNLEDTNPLSVPLARVVIVPDQLVARYRWSRDYPIDSEAWVSTRSAVLGLADWLMTPPNKRDNARVFTLGNRL
jgi:hypothetical protein